MLQRLFPVCLAVLLALHFTPASADPAHTLDHPEFGFRLHVPEGWTQQRDGESDEAAYQLILQPPGGGAEIQFDLWVVDLGDPADPAVYRDRMILWLRTQADYVSIEPCERKLSGRSAPGFQFVRQNVGPTRYRARQAILADHGLRYVLQYFAPEARFDELRPVFEGLLDGFELVPLADQGAADQRIRALAAKCGSEMNWAADAPTAIARARAEGRLLLVYVRAFPGFHLTDGTLSGAFMDPDVIELTRERFVAVRIFPGVPSFLRRPEAYGLSASTFGAAVLVVTPDGVVARECGCLEPAAVYDALRSALPPAVERTPEDPALRIRRGELDRAEALLASDHSARGHLLKAGVLRRLRRGTEALTELAAARAAGAGDAGAEIDAEESLVQLRLGRYAEAQAAFERRIAGGLDASRAAEATYWAGAILLRLGQKEPAEIRWRALIEAHPDDRWAWKAAGVMRSTGFAFGVGERLDWPPDELLESLRWRARGLLAADQAVRAETDARAWLLRAQRPNGSWTSPMDVLRPGEGISDFTESITALCARALLRTAESPETTAAVGRAVDYLLAQHARRKTWPSPAYYMDYAVWRHACVLQLCAELLPHDTVRRPLLATAAGEIVAQLAAKRRPNGGWSYFVTGDLSANGKPVEQSISFVSAAVILALERARAAGVVLPAGLLEGGLDLLEKMRNANGTFEYMLGDGVPRASGIPGAAGRGPACALALVRGGREASADLRRRLDLYLEHRAALAKEGGKALMHTGEDGQGSHYLFFDYANAAEAVAELPAADRARYREAILQDVLRLRAEDGSFLDSPLNGRDYGTAMALVVFRSLAP